MNYERLAKLAFSQPWAIEPTKFYEILEFARIKAAGGVVANPPEAAARPRSNKVGAVAVLPVYGVLMPRLNMLDEISGGTSTNILHKQFDEFAADPDVKAIVLDIDSPGGSVAGIQEFADAIFKAREQKHIVSVANRGMAASAAYYLGAQADEFVTSPSSMVGSIGVYTMHQDISKFLENEGVKVKLISAGKYKIEGNPYEPLSEEAHGAEQNIVNQYYDMFVKSVARGRNVDVSKVRGGFGEGRLLTARDAKTEGLSDRTATLEEVIAGLGGSSKQQRRAFAAERARILEMTV